MMTPMTVPPSSEKGPFAAAGRALVSRMFGEPRFHADGDLLALAFAADGSLWSVEDPGVLRQWDPASGRQLRRYGLSDLETLWAFSPEACWLASASDDLSLWDVASGQLRAGISQPSWVSAVAFTPDQAGVVTGHDDNMIRLWGIASRGLVRQLDGHERPISALAVHPDGTRLASAAEDRRIHLWDLAGGRLLRTLEGHTDRIPALAWHPQGHILVSAGWDTTARVWDPDTGEPIILLNSHADQVTALAFSPDGQWLACADSALAIHIWDTLTWKTLRVLKFHADEIRCLTFSQNVPNGPRGRPPLLASGGVDRLIHLWDLRRGHLLSDPAQTARQAISLATSPSGPRLASTCGGTALRMWDVATGQAVLQAQAVSGLHAVACSPDGRWLAAGGAERQIRLWDAATGQQQHNCEGQAGPVAAFAFSPDSKIMASASASDGTVWLWDVATGNPVLLIPEAADGCTVESLAFHPDGRRLACGGIDWLATGGSDGAVCLWDVQQPDKVALFDRGTQCLAFHPSGRWLAAASLGETVNIWDVPEQRLDRELGGHREGVTCLAYSPDGRWLVSGSDDRTLRLWNAETGEAIAEHELDSPIKTLGFSPDGAYLFTGNGNTTCYQFEVQRLLTSVV